MREAMAHAPLGDDVLGDDPTVMELERECAAMLGMEAGVYVPSGTMGNQIAIATHCQPGDALICEEEAHILYYEVGGPAVHAGAVSWTLPSRLGVMDPAAVEARILKASLHTPGTKIICLENTHNRAGGTITPLDVMAEFAHIAARHEIKVHLDGARVWNAAVGLGVPVREITQHVHTASVCLSKGLCSPVGSVLCGPAEFIERARIWRKRMGGGMRQAGLLAACGLVSLRTMVDRLAEDHARARRTAEAITGLPGLKVDLDSVQTNIVLVSTDQPATEVVARLAEHGIICFPVATNRLRLVFHNDVDDEKTDQAIGAFRAIAAS
ncbi:MAG: aminotransferase class I/II-fold pyridoxal phosphate-dependent enzyme [Armatimonadetes bacterium]|nr:aminotransferase class I/II-fold pyridoxal phosphate-dependent enzyme [Armatimonadota bacterium]